MAGFILGTGGGILAAAAVYYTLSQDLQQQTASLRGDLQNASRNISSTFDPQAPPPAPVSLVGPSYPRQPKFSETLRSRWNLAISNTVSGVRNADWAATGSLIVESAGGLVQKLGGEVHKAEEKLEKFAGDVGRVGEEIVERVEAAKEGKVMPVGVQAPGDFAMGTVGGDLREESLTGGPVSVVKAKRTSEQAKGRLV